MLASATDNMHTLLAFCLHYLWGKFYISYGILRHLVEGNLSMKASYIDIWTMEHFVSVKFNIQGIHIANRIDSVHTSYIYFSMKATHITM